MWKISPTNNSSAITFVLHSFLITVLLAGMTIIPISPALASEGDSLDQEVVTEQDIEVPGQDDGQVDTTETKKVEEDVSNESQPGETGGSSSADDPLEEMDGADNELDNSSTSSTETKEKSEDSQAVSQNGDSSQEAGETKAEPESLTETESNDTQVGDDNELHRDDQAETDLEPGENAQEGSSAQGDSQITTGDAQAKSATTQTVNTSDTDPTADETSDDEDQREETNEAPGDSEDELADAQDKLEDSQDKVDNLTEGAKGEADNTKSTTDNKADLENDSENDANTGNNKAEGEKASIETGNATTHVSVVNVVNTTIFNSNGLIEFLDNLSSGLGDIDLRKYDIFKTPEPKEVSLDGDNPSNSCDDCDKATDSVHTDSDASVSNSLVVRAQTGGNEAVGDETAVTTGEAHAVADVVNVVNSNITDSNYLMMVVNNFGDFSGDFVFPQGNLLNKLFSSTPGGSVKSISSSNDNTANIENQVKVSADTGDNEGEGGTTTISTGDATANANVINQANTNLLGADSLVVLFRVHGQWTGDVFGAPDGLRWTQTGNGIQVMLEEDSQSSDQSLPVETDVTSTLDSNNQTESVDSSSKANIKNDIQVFALTGDNKVSGSNNSITTGKASATANIINVANTNVVGRNWLLAVVNIFGDWDGDIAFGRPDLWVGTVAELGEENLEPGSRVTYRYTITNKGDAPANDVQLNSSFDTDIVALEGDVNGKEDLGTLDPGESTEVTMSAVVKEEVPEGEFAATNSVSVSATETDEDESDNTDSTTITIINKSVSRSDRSRSGEDRPKEYAMPNLIIDKEKLTPGPIQPGNTVDYRITVINDSRGPAFASELRDILRHESGRVIQEQGWTLDTIHPGEEITISYSVQFNLQAPAGVYTNEAQIFALGKNPNPYDAGLEITSNPDSVEISITESESVPEPEVLGADTESSCSPLITTYLRPQSSYNNENQVRYLQGFLLSQGYTSVSVTGEYDLMTDIAIRDLQESYRSEILEPWGIDEPTGYVYYTTQKKINELHCGEKREFSLSQAQEREIISYKNRAQEPLSPASPQTTPQVATRAQGTSIQVSHEENSSRQNITKESLSWWSSFKDQIFVRARQTRMSMADFLFDLL